MISEATRAHFADFAAQRITFTQFSRRTQKFWQAASRYLLTRWRGPDAVEVDDLVQELLLEAWRSFPMHDPARGDLTEFVCYQATSRAKRWLHGQRGRRKCSRSDKAPSRFPIRFANVRAIEGDEDKVAQFISDVLGNVEPEQEVFIERQELTVHNVKIISECVGNTAAHSLETLQALRAYIQAEGNIMQAIDILVDTYKGVNLVKLEELRDLAKDHLLRAVSCAIEVRQEEIERTRLIYELSLMES